MKEDKGGASGQISLHVMTAITVGPLLTPCENQHPQPAANSSQLKAHFIININNQKRDWIHVISCLIAVLLAILSQQTWKWINLNFSSAPNQTKFELCWSISAVWLFGIPFPRKRSRCSIYYARSAKNLSQDNRTRKGRGKLCWPDSAYPSWEEIL